MSAAESIAESTAEIRAQVARIIAALDARLRRGLISREEHLISVGELQRWAARATKQCPEDED